MSAATTVTTVTANLLKIGSVRPKKKSVPEPEQSKQENTIIEELASFPTPKSHNILHSTETTELLQQILNIDNVTEIDLQPDDSLLPNNETCLMIQDTTSYESSSRLQLILSQMDQLKFEEKLLLYLKLPAYFVNPNVTCDPLKQPLNPLGNRYEIHQTIMWIKTHLEEDPEVSLPKQDVYDEYNTFCAKNSMKPLSTADFGKVMKQVYPRVRPRRLGTRGNSRYCYAGMRKRLVLEPPTLTSANDEEMEETGESNINEDMVGAASALIREWAGTYFNMKFSTLSTLGKYLVDNLFVDNKSLAAVCIMNSSHNPQLLTKSADSYLGSTQMPVSKKIVNLRDDLVLSRQKLEYSDKIHQSSDDFQLESTDSHQGEASISNLEIMKEKGNRSKRSLNQRLTKNESNITMKMNNKCPSPNVREKKFLRLHSQPCSSSLPFICDNSQKQLSNNKQIYVSQGLKSYFKKVPLKKGALKKPRKRASSCVLNSSESNDLSPDKLLKLVSSKNSSDSITNPVSSRTIEHHSNSVELKTIKPPVILAINSIVDEKINCNINNLLKSCDKSLPLCCESFSKSNDRSDESDVLSKFHSSSNYESISLLQKQLGALHSNALEDYANVNNSQEQEEELLQYFQQSSSSSSDVELSKGSKVIETNAQSFGRDKVSQLRIILQENLKDLVSVPNKSIKEESLDEQKDQPTPDSKLMLSSLLTDQNSSRRRVSFDTSVTKLSRTRDTSDGLVVGSLANTSIPSSPNTRRRIFDFTPISPTPSHSSVTTGASKCSSADGSPFVSPRNTPMLRSRSNLQRSSTLGARFFKKQPLSRSASSCNMSDFYNKSPFITPPATVGIGAPSNVSQTLNSSCMAHQFLSDLTSQEPQLLINYPSQENLQEIKDASSKQSQRTDQEISDLLLNEKQLPFSKDQELFYRSQSVPLHRMVDPALLSPILTHQLTPTPTPTPTPTLTPIPTPVSFFSMPQNSSSSNNNSGIPFTVPTQCDHLNSTSLELKLCPENKIFITESSEIFEALSEANEQCNVSSLSNNIEMKKQENSNQAILGSLQAFNEPVRTSDLTLKWFDNEAVCNSDDPGQSMNTPVRSIYSRSYPNTPLPSASSSCTLQYFDRSNGSKSYPTTPQHHLQSLNSPCDFHNEPMLCSPTIDSIAFQNKAFVHIDRVCSINSEGHDTEFLEPDLPNEEADNMDSLTNFDQLQDVDTLTPLFTEVVE